MDTDKVLNDIANWFVRNHHEMLPHEMEEIVAKYANSNAEAESLATFLETDQAQQHLRDLLHRPSQLERDERSAYNPTRERFQVGCSVCGFFISTEPTFVEALATAKRLQLRHNSPGEQITIFDMMAQRGACELWDVNGKCLHHKAYNSLQASHLEGDKDVDIAVETIAPGEPGEGKLIRAYIGTRWHGPVLGWEKDGWINYFSHGDYGRNFTHGGTWSAKTTRWPTIEDALSHRTEEAKELFYDIGREKSFPDLMTALKDIRQSSWNRRPSQLEVDEPCELISPRYYSLFWLLDVLSPVSLLLEPEEKNRKIDEVLEKLKAGVEAIQQSTIFREFLIAMGKFHDYSLGNITLIMFQRPTATRVAGFNTWRDLGRIVRKGEKGIAILAPCLPPKGLALEETWTNGKQWVLRGRYIYVKEGAGLALAEHFPAKEEAVRWLYQQGAHKVGQEEVALQPRYFKVVYVFDISQTEGRPLPEITLAPLTGVVNEDLFARAMALGRDEGLNVSYESRPEQDPKIKGQYWPPKNIWVRPEETRADQLGALLHEEAHYFTEGVFGIPRADAETIAESATFAVAAHFGFDTGTHAFPYVAVWAQEKAVLERNLSNLRKVAMTMIHKLEAVEVISMSKGLNMPSKLEKPYINPHHGGGLQGERLIYLENEDFSEVYVVEMTRNFTGHEIAPPAQVVDVLSGTLFKKHQLVLVDSMYLFDTFADLAWYSRGQQWLEEQGISMKATPYHYRPWQTGDVAFYVSDSRVAGVKITRVGATSRVEVVAPLYGSFPEEYIDVPESSLYTSFKDFVNQHPERVDWLISLELPSKYPEGFRGFGSE